MAFDKEEVKQLKELFNDQGKKFSHDLLCTENRITKSTDKKIDDLAVMVKNGFDEMGDRLNNHAKDNSKELSEIKKELHVVRNSVLNLEFIATEMVRRDEFQELKRRLELLEAKLS